MQGPGPALHIFAIYFSYIFTYIFHIFVIYLLIYQIATFQYQLLTLSLTSIFTHVKGTFAFLLRGIHFFAWGIVYPSEINMFKMCAVPSRKR